MFPTLAVGDAGAPAPAGPAAEVVVSLALEPDTGALDSHTLVLQVPAIGARVTLGSIPDTARCSAHTLDAGEMRKLSQSHTGGLAAKARMIAGCGLTLGVTVSLEDDVLDVDSAAVARAAVPAPPSVHAQLRVPAGAPVTMNDAIAGQPACNGGLQKGPEVLVTVDAVEHGGERVLRLRAPTLGFDLELPLFHDGYCHGFRYSAARRLDITCAHAEAGFHVSLAVEGDTLVATTGQYNYGEWSLQALGGVPVPCGARVALPKVHLLDPKWATETAVDMCAACSIPDDLCKDPCFDTMTDSLGTLTPQGEACVQKCSEDFAACSDRCVRKQAH
jgi:hypothetical protein